MSKKIVFERSAFEDFTAWAMTDKGIYRRIVALILDILREPFAGLGKARASAS
jgi:toxin YoeB